MEQDPEGFKAGDRNLYRYVGNDPVAAIDPSGCGIGDNTGINIIHQESTATNYQVTAVARAIQIASGGSPPGNGTVQPGDPDFARVPDVTKLPPMPWTPTYASHGEAAWETPVTGTDYALKLYFEGGRYWIAVVRPTASWGHRWDGVQYWGWKIFTIGGLTGYTYVNYNNAVGVVGQIPGG